MIAQLLTWKATIVGAWFFAFFILERLAVAAPPPASAKRLFQNGALWLINAAMSPFIVLPIAAYAAAHLFWIRPDWLTGWFGLIVSLLALDFWTYCVHRAYHEFPAMWRLHEVHHRDQHLDTTSAVRFHAGEVVLSALLRTVPIFLLAMPLLHVVLFETLLLMTAIFHHSNVRLPDKFERALSYCFVTPSIHWVHHHAVKTDTDSNYASLLSLWDRVFATRSAAHRTRDMKIGVEGLEDKGLLRLLVLPILRERT